MKLNISYLRKRYIIDVLPTDNVYKIKSKIQLAADLAADTFSSPTLTKSQSNLMLNNTVLKDEMVVCDIGLVSGTTLQYKVVETQKCKLKIVIKFLKKVIDLGKEVDTYTTTVGNVRVILQNLIGIPMSIFYLTQPDKELELYDMHELTYYEIKEGDTLNLSVWKGTKGVILGALQSDISKTMSNLPNFYENPTLNRYLLRCVLFIAAHHDYTKLAALILQRGIRCEEAVGEHSSRQWCSTQSHPGNFKTPIHQAAQMGSFSCLKMFVRHSPSSMICRDAYELTPSNYASKHKKFECWKLLIASQFVHARINGFSLASHARIMRWCSAAKERVNYFKGDGYRHSLLLHSTIGRSNKTYLGNEITVAGFDKTKQTFAPIRYGLQKRRSTLSRQNSRRMIRRKSNLTNENRLSRKGNVERAQTAENLKQKYRKNSIARPKFDNGTPKSVESTAENQNLEIKKRPSISRRDTKITFEDEKNENEQRANTDNNVNKISTVEKEFHTKEETQNSIVGKIKRDNDSENKEPSKIKKGISAGKLKKTTEKDDNISDLQKEKITSGSTYEDSYYHSIALHNTFPLGKEKYSATKNLQNFTRVRLERVTNGEELTFLSNNSKKSFTTMGSSNRSIKLPPMRHRSRSLASGIDIEEHDRVQALIAEATGMSSKDLANQCLELGETFNDKTWIKQFNIAINSSTNRIKRGRPRSKIPEIS